jgi:hypothetical protein
VLAAQRVSPSCAQRSLTPVDFLCETTADADACGSENRESGAANRTRVHGLAVQQRLYRFSMISEEFALD